MEISKIGAIVILCFCMGCSPSDKAPDFINLNPDSFVDKSHSILPGDVLARGGGYYFLARGGGTEVIRLDSLLSESIRTGRSGDGPGEFRSIRRLTANEKKLVVYDDRKNALEVFDLDLNHIHSVALSDRYFGFFLDTKGDLYATSFLFDEWRLKRKHGPYFDTENVIHIQNTRRTEQGVTMLSSTDGKIVVSNIFTNRFTVFDLESNDRIATIVNASLKESPDMIETGVMPLPAGPIYGGVNYALGYYWQLLMDDDDTVLIYIADGQGSFRWYTKLESEIYLVIFDGHSMKGITDSGYYTYNLSNFLVAMR